MTRPIHLATVLDACRKVVRDVGPNGDFTVKTSEGLVLAHASDFTGAAWQPIETAPKDGTRILVWCDGNFGQQIVYWTQDDNEWRSECRLGLHPDWPPLFWQPLTEPSKAAIEGHRRTKA